MVRTAIEAVIAALGGVQTMHVCAYDEALGVPTEEAATLALRTQQVVAYETGLTLVVDPFGGAPLLEAETDRLETEVLAILDEIASRGGALACIESGYMADEIGRSAYEQSVAVESGAKVVIGVNRFPSPADPIEVFSIDPASERAQVASLADLRARRDGRAVIAALASLEADARARRNVVPACVAAAHAYATIGEICDRLRLVHGSWRATESRW